VAPLRAGQGVSFYLRRLHSLTGIVPVGAFLIEHILISNSTIINGPTAYAHQVSVSCEFAAGSVLNCSVFGFPFSSMPSTVFTSGIGGETNLLSYPWSSNWMYAAAGVGLAGLRSPTSHSTTYTMRFSGIDLHAYPGASFGKVQTELFQPLLLIFYVLGLLSASWHFAYGFGCSAPSGG